MLGISPTMSASIDQKKQLLKTADTIWDRLALDYTTRASAIVLTPVSSTDRLHATHICRVRVTPVDKSY
jgi:hypothetical protein